METLEIHGIPSARGGVPSAIPVIEQNRSYPQAARGWEVWNKEIGVE